MQNDNKCVSTGSRDPKTMVISVLTRKVEICNQLSLNYVNTHKK